MGDETFLGIVKSGLVHGVESVSAPFHILRLVDVFLAGWRNMVKGQMGKLFHSSLVGLATFLNNAAIMLKTTVIDGVAGNVVAFDEQFLLLLAVGVVAPCAVCGDDTQPDVLVPRVKQDDMLLCAGFRGLWLWEHHCFYLVVDKHHQPHRHIVELDAENGQRRFHAVDAEGGEIVCGGIACHAYHPVA